MQIAALAFVAACFVAAAVLDVLRARLIERRARVLDEWSRYLDMRADALDRRSAAIDARALITINTMPGRAVDPDVIAAAMADAYRKASARADA